MRREEIPQPRVVGRARFNRGEWLARRDWLRVVVDARGRERDTDQDGGG
jgi:hypothetical protein